MDKIYMIRTRVLFHQELQRVYMTTHQDLQQFQAYLRLKKEPTHYRVDHLHAYKLTHNSGAKLTSPVFPATKVGRQSRIHDHLLLRRVRDRKVPSGSQHLVLRPLSLPAYQGHCPLYLTARRCLVDQVWIMVLAHRRIHCITSTPMAIYQTDPILRDQRSIKPPDLLRSPHHWSRHKAVHQMAWARWEHCKDRHSKLLQQETTPMRCHITRPQCSLCSSNIMEDRRSSQHDHHPYVNITTMLDQVPSRHNLLVPSQSPRLSLKRSFRVCGRRLGKIPPTTKRSLRWRRSLRKLR